MNVSQTCIRKCQESWHANWPVHFPVRHSKRCVSEVPAQHKVRRNQQLTSPNPRAASGQVREQPQAINTSHHSELCKVTAFPAYTYTSAAKESQPPTSVQREQKQPRCLKPSSARGPSACRAPSTAARLAGAPDDRVCTCVQTLAWTSSTRATSCELLLPDAVKHYHCFAYSRASLHQALQSVTLHPQCRLREPWQAGALAASPAQMPQPFTWSVRLDLIPSQVTDVIDAGADWVHVDVMVRIALGC